MRVVGDVHTALRALKCSRMSKTHAPLHIHKHVHTNAQVPELSFVRHP
jgi:hypothetical protein